jgi:hypothetical protein
MNRKGRKVKALKKELDNLQIAGIWTLNSPICKTLIPSGNN